MKQVPLVHAGLRRGVAPNRLAKLAKESAAQSATLAAIAQAAMLDREYGDTPEKAAQWSAFCAQMRDASGEVNSAVHAQDQPRVDASMKRLLESCDACHAKFRQQ
jgi:cytochrome c556